MTTYILIMYTLSWLLGYQIAFFRTTRHMGQSVIVTPQLPRGVQDAITPPWSTNLVLTIHAGCLVAVVYGFYQFGWVVGIVSTLGLLILTQLNTHFLPKPDSAYFRGIVISSLMRRYVNYRRDGDDVRALASGAILERLGYPPPDIHNDAQTRHDDQQEEPPQS